MSSGWRRIMRDSCLHMQVGWRYRHLQAATRPDLCRRRTSTFNMNWKSHFDQTSAEDATQLVWVGVQSVNTVIKLVKALVRGNGLICVWPHADKKEKDSILPLLKWEVQGEEKREYQTMLFFLALLENKVVQKSVRRLHVSSRWSGFTNMYGTPVGLGLF